MRIPHDGTAWPLWQQGGHCEIRNLTHVGRTHTAQLALLGNAWLAALSTAAVAWGRLQEQKLPSVLSSGTAVHSELAAIPEDTSHLETSQKLQF